MSAEEKNNNQEHHTRVFGINIQRVIPFVKLRWFSFITSGILILAGLGLYITRGGFNLGIDFKGGIKVELQINNPAIGIKEIRKVMADRFHEVEVNTVGGVSEHHYMITLPIVKTETNVSEVDTIVDFIGQTYGKDQVVKLGSEIVEPKIGATFTRQSLKLILIAAVLILIYMVFRFNFYYGAGAVGAVVHDMLMMLAFTMFFNIPIDVTVIAAILTILGYSVNDTIVVFDRIRELRNNNKDEDLEYVMDKAITQTLSRTIITSLTVFFVALAVFLWGGIVLKNFALLMLVGVIDGTYSSIFIAAPITYMFQIAADKNKKKKKETAKASS